MCNALLFSVYWEGRLGHACEESAMLTTTLCLRLQLFSICLHVILSDCCCYGASVEPLACGLHRSKGGGGMAQNPASPPLPPSWTPHSSLT